MQIENWTKANNESVRVIRLEEINAIRFSNNNPIVKRNVGICETVELSFVTVMRATYLDISAFANLLHQVR